MNKKVVVFSGAGMSAESGIKTFRDSGGLWEQYKIEEVATPEAWSANPNLVLDFYNARRKQILKAVPNEAHLLIAKLENHFDVHIVTQNIDDLHERAGSTDVLHLHGEILKARSTLNPELVYPVKNGVIKNGDCCELGSQLRPHIVWFGEEVPALSEATLLVKSCDILIVIGTSLTVYPAAGLIHYAPAKAKKYFIDPNLNPRNVRNSATLIAETAVEGMKILFQQLCKV